MELLPILIGGQQQSISLKEILDFIKSPKDKCCKDKAAICKLEDELDKIKCYSKQTANLATSALSLSKNYDGLIREALASARRAELDLVKLGQLETRVSEDEQTLQNCLLTITTDVSDERYTTYIFKQGGQTVATVQIPRGLIYLGGDYIGIDSNNTIYFKKVEFENDYIIPLQEAITALEERIQGYLGDKVDVADFEEAMLVTASALCDLDDRIFEITSTTIPNLEDRVAALETTVNGQ